MWQEQATYGGVAKTQEVNRQQTRHFKNEVPQTINKPPAVQVGGFVIQEKEEMKSK